MTDEELKALVAQNSLAIRELREEGEKSRQEGEKSRQEGEKSRQEGEKSRQEAEKARQLADQRWQEFREEMRTSRQEAEKARQFADQRWQRFQEDLHASRQEMDRAMRAFHKEQGRLANRFGDHVEAMIIPSLKSCLEEDFGMTIISARLRVRRGGEIHEFDMVAHGGQEVAEVYIAEIKAKLRQEGIEQLLRKLRQFPRLFPEHRDKKLFGILAAIDIPEDPRAKALQEGLYLATIRDDVFEISPPDDFEPRVFGLRVTH